MFDISFAELLVISVVALVVIGPEKLPRVARTLGFLVGRARRYVETVKHDIRNEIELDELRRIKDTVQDTAQSIEESVKQEIQQIQASVQPTSLDGHNKNFKDTSPVNSNHSRHGATPIVPQTTSNSKTADPARHD